MGVSIRAMFDIICEGKDWDKPSLLSSQCFHNTVLVWIPCGWLWLSLIGYIPYLRRLKSYSSSVTPIDVIKMVLSGLLAIKYMADVLHFMVTEISIQNDLFSAKVITFFTMILSMILQFVEWKKRLITSGVNFMFAILLFFTMAITLILTNFDEYKGMQKKTLIIIYVLDFILKFALVVAFSFAKNDSSKNLTAAEKASFLSRITFFWMTRIMIKGCKGKLSEQDVPSLKTSEQAECLHDKFIKTEWMLSNKNEKSSVPLIKTIFHMYWKEMAITFILRLLYDILIFCNPLLLNVFMTYLRNTSKEKSIGYVYSLLFFTINVISVLLDQAVFVRGWKTGTNVSTTLMTIIYEKMQKIGIQPSENVAIINLLSTHVNMFQEFIPYLFILWSGPLQMLICFGILLYFVGLTAAYCFLIIPVIIIFFIISKKIEKLQKKYNEMKSKRINLLEEMIEYVKSMKLFAKEDAYLKKLKKIRDKEINVLKKRGYYEYFISTLGEITPLWITLLIFITLDLLQNVNNLTTEHIFVTLMALNILETNLSMYSDCIFDVIKAKESYKNIVTFLNIEECGFKLDHEISHSTLDTKRGSLDLFLEKPEKKQKSPYSVEVTNATFKDNCLKDINLKIKAGELVAVCGHNNSGKSALLYMLLGQIKKESGKVSRCKKVAFTPQEPWVMNDTVKWNILFGKKFDERHFQQTLKYCCLNEEVKQDTVINGKGSNLSGGQLYRINLARAVYSCPHIFLLDNPLCAIDVTTARQIYDNLLGENGLLKKITRIIVTQPSANWLPKADQIIVMDSNTIAESGTFKELMAKKGKFVELLEQCPQNKELERCEEEDKLSFFRFNQLQHRPILQTTSQVGSKFWKTVSTRFKNKTVLLYHNGAKSERFNRQLSRKLYMNKKSMKTAQLKFEDLSTQNSTFKVSRLVFRNYLKTIGFCVLLATILLGCLFEGFRTGANYLFENWSILIQMNGTVEEANHPLYYAGSFSVASGIFLFLFGVLSTYITAEASCKIHHSIAEHVFNMPLFFFENTDQGAIMLTFTDNLYDVDYELPNSYKMWVKDFLRILVTVILFSKVMSILTIALVFIIIAFIIISVIFIRAAYLLQEFNFKFLGCLYTHFLETESGTHIIKAYNNEEIFIKKAYRSIDNSQKFFSSVIAAKRWSGFLLQFIGCLIILISCFYFVAVNEISRVGLILSYLIQIVKCFDWVVRTSSDIAIKRVSLHKIQNYRKKVENGTNERIVDWPIEGIIEFLNYSATYDKNSPNCLNDINLCINAGEKVGIIGKSGSGKSSLVMAITRFITSVKGQINIDGMNIGLINDKYLRSKLTIFPQNTHLFSGNLRSNLDPEDKFTDDELKRVLADVHLESRGLDKTCELFSVGEKQLVGLAKCILNKTKILILDECTANVCATLDEQIQRIIEEKFSDCTVLSIVHKLSMVEKYDKILVMDKGEVKEFDTPKRLSKKKHGFYVKLKEQDSLEN